MASSLTVADRLLDELVAVFRAQFMDRRDALRPDLFNGRGKRRALPKWGGFSAGAAAFLATTPDPRNPWHGREDLLELAYLAGDRLVLDHVTVGRTQVKANHFTIYPLASLYHLVADVAGAQRRNAWRELLARNLKQVDVTIDRCFATLGRPGPDAGTGPNHFFGWFGVGMAEACVLGDTRMQRKIEKAMLRHLTIQTAAGYFPEHSGPAVGYQTVSLDGIAEFHANRRLPAVANALTRGVDFLLHALYPDARGIDTFDERNRLGHRTAFLAPLVWTPAGRALASRVLAKRAAERAARRQVPVNNTGGERSRNGVDWWPLGMLYRMLEQSRIAGERGRLTEAPLPSDSPRTHWLIEKRGLVRREAPWFHTMSAWCNTALPGNPYHFDRLQAFSLYHDALGIIVGGGNDKRSPHNGTVHVVEEGEVHYYPPKEARIETGTAPRVLKGLKRCDRLIQDYGCAQATLEAAPRNPRRFELALAATSNMVNHEIALVLQLTLKAPQRLKTGAGRGLKTIRLKAEAEPRPMESLPLGAVLELPGQWRLHLSSGATLQWPHRPWNPYFPPEYRTQPADAVALVRVPIAAETGRATVTVEVL